MNVRNLASLLLSLLTFVVFGCGGGGGSAPDPNAPASLTVSAAPTPLFLNASSTITANVLKADGTAVPAGTVVTFTTTGGTLSGASTTNASGNATATLTSAAAGAFTVSATAGSLPAKTVVVTYTVNPNLPVSVAVTGLSQVSIGTSVVLTATVTPGAGGTIADNTAVTFASLTPGATFTAAKTVGGVATSTLSGIAAPASVNVTATAGGVVSPAKLINFVDPNSPNSITMSNTTTPGFINGQRAVVITANVVRIAGGPVPAGTPVTFAITAGTGTLAPASPISTDASGNASVTLNSTVEGNVTVRATAASAVGTATIAFTNPNKPGSIVLAAAPASGVTNGQTSVTLTATVAPADVVNGTLPAGTTVNFTILTGTGGAITAATTTNASGVATATLNSTVVGTLSVNATAGTAPVVTSNSVSVPFIAQPTLAIVKIRTNGTLPANTTIGGVNAIVSATPSTGLTIASGDVSASGAGAGSTLVPNVTNVAAINLALINVSGIQVGEFATLNYHIAAGTFPVAGNFSVALTGAGVIDTVGANIPGITVSVLSVTIQ